ncbi:MAG: response regulator [Acidobacteria bacterium]|nr:response regulator [Acidobacteriota bacterium]MBI3428030.1 response regulator [Acidobacteriota bacterium]
MDTRGELHLLTDNDVKIFPLETPRFTVGRGTENSLCLPHGVVSRAHAEIIRLGDDFLLRDLGSTNGSYVNNVRVAEQMLNDGDHLRFGHGGPEVNFKILSAVASDAPTDGAPKHPRSTTQSLIQSLSGRMLDAMPADPREEANLRCVLAEQHLNQGQAARAMELLNKYTDPATLSALSLPFRASVLLTLGRTYCEGKQTDMALEALQQSLNCYAQSADEAGSADAHAAWARALIGSGELFEARQHLQRSLLATRRAGNTRLLAELHYMLGRVDWKEGDFEGARYHWLRASRLAETTTDQVLRARVKVQEAFVLYAEAKLKDAVPVYQEAIQQIQAIGNTRLLLKAQSGLSRVLTRLGSWGAALRLFEERLQLAQQHKLVKAEAVALTDLAELKLYQGDLMTAWNAIQAAVQRHGQSVYARTQRILGRVLMSRGQRAEAIEALEKGVQVAREKGAFEEQILLELELALVHLEKGDLAKAQTRLEAAEAITALDPELGLAGRVLYVRGSVHAAQQQVAEANRSFAQSLSIFQSIGDQFRTALCEAALGDLRTHVGRLESARAHLEQAQSIFAKLGATGEMRRIEVRLAAGALASVQGAMTAAGPGISKTAYLTMSRPLAKMGATTMLAAPQIVLLAIGNGELASLLARGLEAENYVVEQTQDGKTAYEQVLNKERDFGMLVLDALLAHKSGFDVCRDLRKAKLETPVILLGGRQGIEDKIEALQAGADDFLSKRNLVFEELLAKMEALLR